MLTVLAPSEAYKTPCALILGGFDGLHVGHMQLLEAAKKTGLPVCITTILGGRNVALLSKDEREFVFEQAGIDCVLELNFTNEFQSTSAEDFLRRLFSQVNAKIVFCGEDHRFGKDACGTPALLKELAPCPVEIIPLYRISGEKVSASLVKELLSAGKLDCVNRMIEYFVQGVVEHGRQVGRTYGYPTLNLSIPGEKLLPPDGVYGGVVKTPKGTYKSIINIGARPTFGVEERKLEAHLLDFGGDLYGALIRVYPTVFLRPVMRFASKDALKEQLQRDKESINDVL